MAMVVISGRVMCCTDCGGFQFLAEMQENGRYVVTHPQGEMYMGFDPKLKEHFPCPNIGKRFAFPEQGPVLGIEVTR